MRGRVERMGPLLGSFAKLSWSMLSLETLLAAKQFAASRGHNVTTATNDALLDAALAYTELVESGECSLAQVLAAVTCRE